MTLDDKTGEIMKSTSADLKPFFRYSIEELLQLRESLPLVKCTISNLNKKADIASIFRLPDEAFRNPDQFICLSKVLAEYGIRHSTNPIPRKIVSESSEECDQRSTSVMDANIHFNQSQPLWNLRRRGSSDKSNEPHSAPSSVTAQKAENFQKFYRAVISPTHVRVTAGGRIVPNTRSMGPIGLDCSTDRAPHGSAVSETAQINLNTTSWPHLQAIQTNCPMLMPTGLSQSYNNYQPGYSFAFPSLNPQSGTNPTGDLNSSERSQPPNLNFSTNMGKQESSLSQGIKISHPSQFDQTKPFVINGQLVYPLQSALQPPINAFPLPMGMPGSSNSVSQSQLSNIHQDLLVNPFRNLTNSVPFPLSPQLPLNNQYTGLVLDTGTTPSFIPATSVPISATEFLSSQLRALVKNLNAIEQQIMEKNSQLDRGLLEAQRNSLKFQINSIKNALTTQNSRQGSSEEYVLRDGRSPGPATSTNTTDMENIKRDQKNETMSTTNNIEKKRSESTNIADSSKKSVRSKPPTQSRLSKSSAKAPPFQPRSQTAVENLTSSKDTHRNLDIPLELNFQDAKKKSTDSPKEILGHRDAHSNLGWSTSAHHLLPQSDYLEPASPNFKGNDNTIIADTTNFKSAKNIMGSPYLVGTVSYGSQYNSASSDNILYSRPLTNEEKKARQLYFGKVTHSVHGSLPKFDGKDFYPPSPLKNSTHRNTNLSEGNSVSKNEINHDSTVSSFDTLLTAVEAPSLTVPSIIHRHSIQDLFYSSKPQSNPSDSINDAFNSQENDYNAGRVAFRSLTPRKMNYDKRLKVNNDFNDVFIENSVAGHKSLSLDEKKPDFRNCNIQYDGHVTPSAPIRREKNQDDSQVNKNIDKQIVQQKCASLPTMKNDDSHSAELSVEIQLSPRIKAFSPNLAEQTFAERVESFRKADQQKLLLQNMLKKKSPIVPPVGPVLSGAITSTNARGYLPQYRGSAIASFFPTKLVTNISDCEVDHSVDAKLRDYHTDGISPVDFSRVNMSQSSKFDHHPRSSAFSSEGLVSDRYNCLLTQKDNKKKESQSDFV